MTVLEADRLRRSDRFAPPIFTPGDTEPGLKA